MHFALSVLRKGYRVLMLDVGFKKRATVNPQDKFRQLRTNLQDPVQYFLGENYQGVLLPDDQKEYYGIPPGKDYVFQNAEGFDYRSDGFAPLFSFAAGGLAEAWTGGCYPFNDADLADFPFSYAQIEPYYSEVARRIGIAGTRDDLTRFYPLHDHLLPPLELDHHSAILLETYATQKDYLNQRLGCFFGRTRIATLSVDRGGRKKCDYSGRCLWGCPSDSLWVPSITLAECQQYPDFTYVPSMLVKRFEYTDGNRITSVVARSLENGKSHTFPVGTLVLAAGTLCSSKIFLDSVWHDTGNGAQLRGLMDNRQILVPFLNLKLIGVQHNPDTYQYHQVGIGITNGDGKHYVHGLVTTLKTALLHPIIQNLPCDMKTALFLMRNMHCGLGIVNVNLHDTRRDDNYVGLEPLSGGDSRLVVNYVPAATQKAEVKRALSTLKKALWRLGCLVPPGMMHVRPMGASAHYSGTLPMSREKRRFTTSEYCQSHDFENLYLADGATFPFLPAKNLTFMLMANAARVADTVF